MDAAVETNAEAAVSIPELPESTPASDPAVSAAAEPTPALTPAESKPEETAPETELSPESSPEEPEEDEAAQETAETVDYSSTVEGKAASVSRDFGVKTSAEAKDQATANALDIVHSSLGQFTSDARKKLGTVHISDHDGIPGSDIYVNRSSSTISKDFNANVFRILCGNKSDSFEKGWNDYTSYISDKAATGSVLDDAAETWGYHMASVYGDDQVSAKFGILYNLYGNYFN